MSGEGSGWLDRAGYQDRGRADRSILGHVPAPFVGTVTLQVTEGSRATAGQVIATIEAMKMEAAITAPLDGTVVRLAINPVQPSKAVPSSSLSVEWGVNPFGPVGGPAYSG